MTDHIAIHTAGLTKHYGDVHALVDLNLDVLDGEVFGFLGPNGAGKTTMIRTILDEIHPTAGTATIVGLDSHQDSVEIRNHIGYLPGDIASKIGPYMQPLYDNLGVIRGQFPEKSEMFQRLQKMLDEDKLTIEPLAYIRGRSLVRMYMIVDEAQNLAGHLPLHRLEQRNAYLARQGGEYLGDDTTCAVVRAQVVAVTDHKCFHGPPSASLHLIDLVACQIICPHSDSIVSFRQDLR